MEPIRPWRGARLRELREARGLTRRALAAATGLTEDAIYKMETDARSPAWLTLEGLRVALGLASLDVFGKAPAEGRETRGPGRPKKEPAGPGSPKRPRGRPRKGA